MSAFIARFRGRCLDCGEDIEPGDDVVFVNDVLVHVDCEGDALAELVREERKTPVCTVCWLVMPCACEDGGTAA